MATKDAEPSDKKWFLDVVEMSAYNAEMALQVARMRKFCECMNLDWDDQEPEQQLLRQKVQRLSETVQQQAAEIEALTQLLEEHPVAEYVAGLEEHAEQLEFSYLSVISSTSWKVTLPLRTAARWLFGKEAPSQLEPKFFSVSKRP